MYTGISFFEKGCFTVISVRIPIFGAFSKVSSSAADFCHSKINFLISSFSFDSNNDTSWSGAIAKKKPQI